MALNAPSPYGNNRLLLQLLLMQALQQQQAQQQPQQGGGIQQAVNGIKQARSVYKDGKSAYESLKELFGGGAGGAATSQLGSSGAALAGEQVMTPAGFSSVGEMVGNGLYTPGTPSLAGGMSVAPEAATASGFELSGIGSAGNYYLPALGAIGTADLLMNQRTGKRGYLQGAASGAALGSYFGPWGAVIGGAVGLGAAGANELFDTNRYKKEGNRLQGLIDKGINIPDSLRLPMTLRAGRKKSELVNPYLPKDFVGETPKYGWVNNKFAESRNTKDLTGKDIWGYSAFFDKFGNDWLQKLNEKQREAIANKALQAGAVKEHHGTIDINWNPQLENDIAAITGQRKIKGPAPTTPSQTLIPKIVKR